MTRIRGLAPRGPFRWILASTFLWGCGIGLYATLWPLYVEHLGGDAASIGWLETSSAVITAVTALPGGVVADRWDRRRLMIWGSVVASPAPLLFLWAPSWTWLFLGQALFFGSAFAAPATLAYIQRASGERLAVRYNVVMSAFAGGAVLGSAAGGYLAAHMGYAVLFVLAALCYAASTLSLLPLPAHPRPAETATRHRLLPTLSPRLFQWTSLAVVLTFAGSLAGPYVVPYWRSVGHLPLPTIGLIGALSTLLGALAGPLWGRAAERRGLPDTVAMGLGLGTVGLVGLWGFPRLVPVQVIAAALRGGGAAVHGLLGVAVGRLVNAADAGTAYGMLNWATQAAAALAPMPGAYLYHWTPALPMVVTSGTWFLVVVFLLTRERSRGLTRP